MTRLTEGCGLYMARTLTSGDNTIVATDTTVSYNIKMVHGNDRQPGAREDIMTGTTETRGVDMPDGFA